MYPRSDWRTILLFVLFGVCLIAFIVTEVLTQATTTIKTRVIKNRSIISAMWFMFCLASTMQTFIYYLPLWLQAIKGKSAVQSGIDTLPLVLSLVAGSVLSGYLVGRPGFYAPFTMASSFLLSIGAGLISTFKVNTRPGMWIGYQVIIGWGIGLGMQPAPIAAQTVLQREDVPVGVSLVFFSQQLGGAMFMSVSQNIFSNKLIDGLIDTVGQIDPREIINTGATDLRNTLPTASSHEVLEAYNEALRWVFIVDTIIASLSALGSFTLEWRSVKGEQGPT